MEKYFHPTICNVYNYLSMLGVNKRGPRLEAKICQKDSHEVSLSVINNWRRDGAGIRVPVGESCNHLRPRAIMKQQFRCDVEKCVDTHLGIGTHICVNELSDHILIIACSPSRWRHQMETFSALLAICAGNSPVTGEFPTQSPVTRSFDVFF